MLRRLVLAIGLVLVLAGPVVASDIASVSGRASYSKHLLLAFTLPTPSLVTVTATIGSNKSVVVLDVSGPSGCAETLDQRWGRNPGVTSLSCSFSAPTGVYLAEVWTSSGWTDATVIVTVQ